MVFIREHWHMHTDARSRDGVLDGTPAAFFFFFFFASTQQRRGGGELFSACACFLGKEVMETSGRVSGRAAAEVSYCVHDKSLSCKSDRFTQVNTQLFMLSKILCQVWFFFRSRSHTIHTLDCAKVDLFSLSSKNTNEKAQKNQDKPSKTQT